jgi:hypothetical protein
MASQEVGITFQAILNSAKTTKDGGYLVTLELNGEFLTEFSQLLSLKDTYLQIGVVPITQ